MGEHIFADKAEWAIARSIYPTAWGHEGSAYTPKTALEHTRAAIRSLRRAGYEIVRNRLGAGHSVPEVANLIRALEMIRDSAPDGDGKDACAKTLKEARRIAGQALEDAAK